MQKVILAKYGEIALKGQNKSTFESILIKNLHAALSECGEFEIKKAQSTIYITPRDERADIESALEKASRVFGIAALSLADTAAKDMEDIKSRSVRVVGELPYKANSFKVEAKRADKSFELNSPQICNCIGGYLLENFPELQVDVHNPDFVLTIEIRDFSAYVYADRVQGAGGMPLGSSGKGLVLLSGGIDSPVAAYMMSKRGIKLEALHFASPPYTSGRALEKVHTLCKDLRDYTGDIRLKVAHFTKIQQAIRDNCAEDMSTVIMRRMMMRVANEVAKKRGLKAIVTGESVAQVASQTLDAIRCTDAVAEFPVFRPAAGMDKNEIVEIARKIGTFETSILPYEDCCTVFTPRHPRTRPTLEMAEREEAKFDYELLIREILEDDNDGK